MRHRDDPSTVEAVKFSYFEHQLAGFNSLYNCTYLNERCVELAVAFNFLQGRSFVNGLEVGNVLGHYGVGGHTVVDLYEPASELQQLKRWRVEQVDVFDIGLEVGSLWDWIVAISTLEHVRFDMDSTSPLDLDGSMNALRYLRSLLHEDGQMLVTLPCGFHPVLDELIVEELTGATRACTLVRDGDDPTRWVQTDEPTVIEYGRDGPWASAVWIGEFGTTAS